jgi:hypothetical protein
MQLRLAPWSTVVVALLGCGSADAPFEGGTRDTQSPIINGVADTTHPAVVFVQGKNNTGCSGTIIHKAGSSAFILTAAHCGDPAYVLQGDNHETPDLFYSAVKFARHTKWNGTPPNYDFMMVQVTGATAATPVIPAMSSAQDKLASGTQIRHVGYGKSGPAPGTKSSQRNQILGKLSGVQSITVTYDQPNGGPCSGDSGGPQLTTSGSELVASVTSSGDTGCAQGGTSGRVSVVYDTFITPFINSSPPQAQSCSQCRQAAITGQKATCYGKVQACNNETACKDLMDCLNKCNGDSGCVTSCSWANQKGIPTYNQIHQCTCSTACATECAGDASCKQSSSSSSSSATASSAASTTSAAATTSAGAGGAGAATAAGAGGAQPSTSSGAPVAHSDAWSAGDVNDLTPSGTVVTASCTIGGGRGRADFHLAWLAWLGLVIWRARARRACRNA